jgi:hypothetical protein
MQILKMELGLDGLFVVICMHNDCNSNSKFLLTKLMEVISKFSILFSIHTLLEITTLKALENNQYP